jgi:hypothetical protein
MLMARPGSGGGLGVNSSTVVKIQAKASAFADTASTYAKATAGKTADRPNVQF